MRLKQIIGVIMRLSNLFIICILMGGIFTASCSSPDNTISRAEVNTMQTTAMGIIEQITVVNVDGEQTWVGSTVGSVSGSVLGAAFGSGWGRIVSSLVGSLVGNFAGREVEEQATKTQGLQLEIRLENGEIFKTVVIPDNLDAFKVGDRVKVLISSSGHIEVHLFN